MKNAAGLLVAIGCFTVTCHVFGEPSSRSAAVESPRVTAAELRGGTDSSASPSREAAPSLESLESGAVAPLTLFAAADSNADGTVSYGELTALVRGSVARRIKARFGQVDRNGDGRCTRSEVNKMSAERFARFDLNRDGHFTAAELATVITRQVADRLQRVYARLDADHNGAFTVAELTLPTKTSAPEAEVVATKKSRAQKQPVQVAKRGPGAVQ